MVEGAKSELTRDLKRERLRLLAPSLLSGMVAGPLATYYAVLVMTFPPGVLRVFLTTAAVVLPAVMVLITARLLRRMQALWRLADGRLPPTTEHLKAAMREVALLPDFTFTASFGNWSVAVGAVCVALWVWAPAAELELYIRTLVLGAVFSPLTGFLAQLTTGLLSRQVLARLAREGLQPGDIFEVVPPKRFRLRAWLLFFILFYALTPMFLTVDAAHCLAEQGLQRVLDAADDPVRQKALAEQALDGVTVPVLSLFLLAAVTALATAAGVGSSLRRPMREIAAQATRITEGRLDRASLVFAEDEVWVVSATFSQMQDELSKALTQLQQAGLRLSTSSEQLVGTFGQQESGAAEQASALNETSATTEELARSAAQIAENAGSVAEVAERTLQAAQAGQRSSEDFFEAMQRMRSETQAVADSVLKLNKRVQQIGKIVEFIHGIADKSDLLALNAELEGTKAGEVGRGFSLVAAEMRRLAENVLKSTQEIERLIQEIRDATHAAVMATEAGMKATERGASTATTVLESLRQIVELAKSTSDAVRSISLATQQQQSGTDQLAGAMAEILRVTQQSSAATRQMSAANLDLAALAKDLKAVVDRFQVNNV